MHPVCITALLIQCILGKSFENLKLKDNFIDTNKAEQKYLHPEFFGILHRLEDYSSWAQKEELIVAVAKKRLALVQEEIKLMKTYLEDFEDSSGNALRNMRNHVPSNKSTERGMVIASNSVLAHRMVHRCSSIVEQQHKLIGARSYKLTNGNSTYVYYMLGSL